MSCALVVFAGAEFWHQLVVLPEIEATSWRYALTLMYTQLMYYLCPNLSDVGSFKFICI
jgi:hypothetical protein